MAIATETGLSFEAYCALDRTAKDGMNAGDCDRFELINGKLKPMNPPKTQHFFIAKGLERAIEAEIERLGLAWVCLQGAGLRTGVAKSRLPDLMVVDRAAAIALWQEEAIFQVTPRLVVEMVSPSSATDDYRYKRMEYGAIEVPEYWIVDPLAQRVTLLRLVKGWYEEGVYAGRDRLASTLLPGLAVTAGQVLAAGDGIEGG